MHEFLRIFMKILIIIHGVVLFTLLALILAIVGVLVPTYAWFKRKIRFNETMKEIPGMFLFVLTNVIPGLFIGLPVYLKMKRNAKAEQEKISYKYDLSKLKKGDIILTGKDDWGYSMLIQLTNILSSGESDRYWTHACIYTGEGTVIEAQAGGLGVTERDLIEIYEKNNYKIAILRHKYASEEEIDRLIAFGKKQIESKCKYDTLGLIFYVLTIVTPPMFNSWIEGKEGDYVDRLFDVSKSYFCSELVADAFKDGVRDPAFLTESWRVKPLDFKKNLLFEEIKDVCVVEEDQEPPKGGKP